MKEREAPGAKKPAVVGIGASAGGLAALRTFFENTPGDTGLSFVVVVHLAPDHESHLADLLQPHAHMPVTQVRETLHLEPNQVYVIPPGHHLSAIDSDVRPPKRDRRGAAAATSIISSARSPTATTDTRSASC